MNYFMELKNDKDFMANLEVKGLEFNGKSEKPTQGGQMSVDDPLIVSANNGMSEEDFKACSFMMNVCKNMIQQNIVEAAQQQKIPITKALKSIEAWVSGFAAFPFPLFNFESSQSKNYEEKDFSINATDAAIDAIVNIKNVDSLKDSVVKALKDSSGNIASYHEKKEKFKYFGVISGYNDKGGSVRVISFTMDTETIEVKTFCGGSSKMILKSDYDTYYFTIDKYIMIALYNKVRDKTIEEIAEYFLKFVVELYKDLYKKFQSKIADSLKDLV